MESACPIWMYWFYTILKNNNNIGLAYIKIYIICFSMLGYYILYKYPLQNLDMEREIFN